MTIPVSNKSILKLYLLKKDFKNHSNMTHTLYILPNENQIEKLPWFELLEQ